MVCIYFIKNRLSGVRKLRINFSLNDEYDAGLIDFLNSQGNRSRIIRKLLRKGHEMVTQKTAQQDLGQQKNQPKKLVWKI